MLYGMCHGDPLEALCTHSPRKKFNVYERCEVKTVSGTLKDHKDNREIFILKNVGFFYVFLCFAQVGAINLHNLLARQTPSFKMSLRRRTVSFIVFVYVSRVLWHINWCVKSKIWHFLAVSISFTANPKPFFRTMFMHCFQKETYEIRCIHCLCTALHFESLTHNLTTHWRRSKTRGSSFHKSRLDWWLKTPSVPPETIKTFISLPLPAAVPALLHPLK